MTQAPLVRKFEQVVGNVAAGADLETAICEAPFAGTVTSVSYIPDTAITGADTDSRTVSLINKGQAGSGTTEVAALAMTAGVNSAQWDEKAITLSGTAANLVVAAGDILVWKSLHVGATGLADPGGTVQVEITRA